MAHDVLTPDELTEGLASLSGWTLERQCSALTREFLFEDFQQAFAFMTEVALAAERHDHHPEWSNVYRTVRITWTSHDVGGLSQRDLRLARLCDAIARRDRSQT